jgi:hypothetical protein
MPTSRFGRDVWSCAPPCFKWTGIALCSAGAAVIRAIRPSRSDPFPSSRPLRRSTAQASSGPNSSQQFQDEGTNNHPRCTNRCTKTSQRIPMSPMVADYRTSNLLILLMPAVALTAEVASSSLVVPAIIPKKLRIGGVFPIGAKRCASSLLAPHLCV